MRCNSHIPSTHTHIHIPLSQDLALEAKNRAKRSAALVAAGDSAAGGGAGGSGGGRLHTYVAKISLDPRDNKDREIYFKDVEMQTLAKFYAKQFNGEY